jgi:D-sedoheptulose 7-phosphate isomerase
LYTVNSYFQRVVDVLPRIPAEPVERIIGILKDAQAHGRRIFMFGNGGSSATASHIVTDLVKSVLVPGRPRFRVLCLSDNTPMLTAYSNDVSYDVVFAQPLAALAEPGDVAFAISGSGNSPNVLRAMDVAQEKDLTRIGLTGFSGGALKDKCDVCVVVPSDSMQVVEDAHLVILHAIYLALCE